MQLLFIDGYPHNWCTIFDHQCKHLCYYRYVCTYCLQKYQQSTSQRKRNSNFNETNDLLMKTYRKCQLLDDINDYGQMFLSFISATTVRNHIEQKHTTAEFKNVTFKRWMSVDSLEYQLRKCYSHFGWNFDGELDSYEHEDIRRILQTHMVIKKKKKPFIKIMSENKSEWIRNLYKHYTECPLPKMPTISMNDLEEVLYFVNNLIHEKRLPTKNNDQTISNVTNDQSLVATTGSSSEQCRQQELITTQTTSTKCKKILENLKIYNSQKLVLSSLMKKTVKQKIHTMIQAINSQMSSIRTRLSNEQMSNLCVRTIIEIYKWMSQTMETKSIERNQYVFKFDPNFMIELIFELKLKFDQQHSEMPKKCIEVMNINQSIDSEKPELFNDNCSDDSGIHLSPKFEKQLIQLAKPSNIDPLQSSLVKKTKSTIFDDMDGTNVKTFRHFSNNHKRKNRISEFIQQIVLDNYFDSIRPIVYNQINQISSAANELQDFKSELNHMGKNGQNDPINQLFAENKEIPCTSLDDEKMLTYMKRFLHLIDIYDCSLEQELNECGPGCSMDDEHSNMMNQEEQSSNNRSRLFNNAERKRHSYHHHNRRNHVIDIGTDHQYDPIFTTAIDDHSMDSFRINHSTAKIGKTKTLLQSNTLDISPDQINSVFDPETSLALCCLRQLKEGELNNNNNNNNDSNKKNMSTSSSKQQREQKESPSQGHNVLAGRSTLLSSPSPPTKATTILKKMTETKFEIIDHYNDKDKDKDERIDHYRKKHFDHGGPSHIPSSQQPTKRRRLLSNELLESTSNSDEMIKFKKTTKSLVMDDDYANPMSNTNSVSDVEILTPTSITTTTTSKLPRLTTTIVSVTEDCNNGEYVEKLHSSSETVRKENLPTFPSSMPQSSITTTTSTTVKNIDHQQMTEKKGVNPSSLPMPPLPPSSTVLSPLNDEHQTNLVGINRILDECESIDSSIIQQHLSVENENENSSTCCNNDSKTFCSPSTTGAYSETNNITDALSDLDIENFDNQLSSNMSRRANQISSNRKMLQSDSNIYKEMSINEQSSTSNNDSSPSHSSTITNSSIDSNTYADINQQYQQQQLQQTPPPPPPPQQQQQQQQQRPQRPQQEAQQNISTIQRQYLFPKRSAMEQQESSANKRIRMTPSTSIGNSIMKERLDSIIAPSQQQRPLPPVEEVLQRIGHEQQSQSSSVMMANYPNQSSTYMTPNHMAGNHYSMRSNQSIGTKSQNNPMIRELSRLSHVRRLETSSREIPVSSWDTWNSGQVECNTAQSDWNNQQQQQPMCLTNNNNNPQNTTGYYYGSGQQQSVANVNNNNSIGTGNIYGSSPSSSSSSNAALTVANQLPVFNTTGNNQYSDQYQPSQYYQSQHSMMGGGYQRHPLSAMVANNSPSLGTPWTNTNTAMAPPLPPPTLNDTNVIGSLSSTSTYGQYSYGQSMTINDVQNTNSIQQPQQPIAMNIPVSNTNSASISGTAACDDNVDDDDDEEEDDDDDHQVDRDIIEYSHSLSRALNAGNVMGGLSNTSQQQQQQQMLMQQQQQLDGNYNSQYDPRQFSQRQPLPQQQSSSSSSSSSSYYQPTTSYDNNNNNSVQYCSMNEIVQQLFSICANFSLQFTSLIDNIIYPSSSTTTTIHRPESLTNLLEMNINAAYPLLMNQLQSMR
ncbi:hypothetical protein HUG17_0189 [Dermatophagoides farinae]|uniref:Uncharacterized protein n=1 Tax=Dermatophagoides farinae TaxID=6954 RepID=A0A9D4P4L1_DERFA|nr:hypothetical protein HUG17_0189 [Dermatophagoides farinae]